ncbi:MOSC domain-containing protein [Paenactinomyces guangxiensis]|uniref:MOSC domain-containing protein n=1 Tax=Paenactinomyces guangxiensis TaxID=1490290 RepID=A0A7W1WS55_9BACL|nr:MOSC domain-containing protein [Paenactinomyces guangxiensis]MBA4495060.1 MOSC domain-containing protein [Paenactinomyces guangxiensis]MBH8592256.1 MOSC domain-containing protein [Paenactinomyces guangxiensis]
MSQASLLMIHVGLPKTIGVENTPDQMDRPWRSGIFKSPVEGPVWVGRTNVEGDGQADLKNHGGPDKAVLAYSADHYAVWKQELQLPDFHYGALGENFTIANQTEKDVCIGDTYRIGGAIVQISQPRQPCWKPARRWKIKDLTVRIQNTGRTGWYFRVLKEGCVERGQEVLLLDRSYPQWTVALCNEIMYHRKDDRKAAFELASCPLLSESWTEILSKRFRSNESN